MQQAYLVTGANKGIGLAIVRRILLDIPDSFVYLGSRDPSRGKSAVNSIISENSKFKSRIKMIEVDVASKASILSSANEIMSHLDANNMHLVGLVNNAGMIGSFKEVFDVNVTGVYNTTNAFIPIMLSEGSEAGMARPRVVHISSGAAPLFVEKCNQKWIDFFTDKNDDLTWDQLQEMMESVIQNPETKLKEMGYPSLSDFTPYQISKATLNALMLVQTREHPDVMINCVSPGMIITDLTTGHFGKDVKGKTPDQGAASCMHLLTATKLKGDGYYYGSDCKRSPLHKYRDPGEPEYDGAR